jgi:putative PIN family toxin of toxin-antitoxin system
VGTPHLMRVVLDSNILFSALISEHGPPHRIYEAWVAERFTLVTCSIQLEEIRRASRYRKFQNYLKPHRVGRMVNRLKDAILVDGLSDEHEAADPNDSWLLALAHKAEANYLVTGDKRAGLLSRGRIGTAHILTAAAFCRDLLRERR